MADIALSKSSLQQQRDRLRLFERFLPSLELKRQQLTAEYKKAVQVLAEAEQGADQASRSLMALLPILGSAWMQLSGLVRIRHVEVAEEDVLGLRLPTLRGVEFDTADYSLLATPGTLMHFVLSLGGGMLREGMHFGVSEDGEAGIRVRLVEEDVQIDLTESAISQLLLRHMLPRFRALLRGAVVVDQGRAQPTAAAGRA